MRELKRSRKKLRKSKANFFDLDRTLVRKNVSFSFYFYLIKLGIVSKATLLRTIPLYFRHKMGSIGLIEIHRQVFRHVLKGQLRKELEEAADDFIAPFVQQTLNPIIHSKFNDAKERGEAVYLLSSSADFLVERVAVLLGFDRCAGTQYSVDKEGRLCDISSLVTGPTKLALAKQWTPDGAHAIVFSDSSDDLPLFEWADLAVAVSPDRLLRAKAIERGWEIIGSNG